MKSVTALRIIWMVAVIIAAGCSLFKNTSSNNVKNHQLSTQDSNLSLDTKLEENKQFNLLSFYKDSSNREYLVELWPRGVFKFSAATGFDGEADSVKISGRSQQVENASMLLNNNQQKKAGLEMDHRQSEKLVKDRKELVKTSTPSWKWIFLIVLGFGAGGFWLYRKLRSDRNKIVS